MVRRSPYDVQSFHENVMHITDESQSSERIFRGRQDSRESHPGRKVRRGLTSAVRNGEKLRWRPPFPIWKGQALLHRWKKIKTGLDGTHSCIPKRESVCALSPVTPPRRPTSPWASYSPRRASDSGTNLYAQFREPAPPAIGSPCKYPAPAECASCAAPPAKAISIRPPPRIPGFAAANAPAGPSDQ